LKGSQYWQYKDYELLPDFPKEISQGFPGAPDNIDAAFVWRITGKVYLFKGKIEI
jgi:matrix metalloproteinase-14 (membrane-inserted)